MRRGAADAEIKVTFAENLKLSKGFSIEPDVPENRILPASFTARISGYMSKFCPTGSFDFIFVAKSLPT